jgi:ribosomal protein S18 acetylase RimI-like enzyme
MARLSNFLRQRDDHDDSAPRELHCRPVKREEVDESLRLLLAGPGGLAGDEQVLDFLSFAMYRGVDVNGVWVAERGGRIEWAMLPVVSPGRTMLLLTPTRLLRHTPARSLVALTNAICQEYGSRDVQLAQLLLDPDQPDVRNAYASASFSSLAELVYLRRPIRGAVEPATIPTGLELRPYSFDADELFRRAISRSYSGSLDCPGLNGVRDIHDVLEGHKGSGEFQPHLWHVLLEGGEEHAVLLLNRSVHGDTMELVYLGLVPAARGRGISDVMMKLALQLTAADGKNELTLAVDSRNAPALKLYFRHGLQRVGSRLAMLRDIRHHSNGAAVLA